MKKKLFIQIMLLSALTVSAQQGPPVYILPAVDKAVIVLGDTPRTVKSFQVYRKGPGEREFRLLTPGPVVPAGDPYQAARLMGRDFDWIAKRMGSRDPELVWRKLQADRNKTLAFCLISHGLRAAMGRTFVDLEVEKGEEYRYRVILLDALNKEQKKIEKKIRIEAPKRPKKTGRVQTEVEHNEVIISWSYPKYRGAEGDRTVGFILYRREEGGETIRITPAPVLRIEDHLSFIDAEVENGKTYTYTVEAVDIIGAVSELVLSAPLKLLDSNPPLVPTGLAAVDRDEGVFLVWKISPELDASYYNVYRGDTLKEGEEFDKLNREPVPLGRPTYLDRDMIRGLTYHYRITAVDKSGNESRPSGPATITPKDKEPPPEVTNLSHSMNERKREVTLTWDPLEIPDLLGYFVYRGRQKKDLQRIVGELLKADRKPSFQDAGYEKRGLQPGATLFYGVAAADTSLNEGSMAIIEIKVPDKIPPGPPLSFFARPTKEGNIQLKWQPNLARDIDRHRIYRKEKRGFIVVSEPAGEKKSWLDETVERGKTYIYRITHLDTSDNESEPSKEIKVIPTDVLPPEPPKGVKAEFTGRGVFISWEQSLSEDTEGYYLYRAAYKGGAWQRITEKPLTKTEYFDRRGREGFQYGISALDTSGNESWKTEIPVPRKTGENLEK